MKLFALNTGYFKLDGGAMFGVVPKSIWNRINPADENNLCNWAMRCLLIEDEERLIVVDTGIGNKQSEKFFSHYYLSEIRPVEDLVKEAGYSPADVTDVLLTHLHFDHCGGTVSMNNGKASLVFPKAIHWSNERHWNWATQPNDREKASFLTENIQPIYDSGKLRFVNISEKTPFSRNVDIRFAYGHTDAMMLPEINLDGKRMVFMADLLPSAGHLPIPYVMSYDMFPLTTLKEKKEFLEEAADNNLILFFEHDEKNECATVARTDKGIRTADLFSLHEMVNVR